MIAEQMSATVLEWINERWSKRIEAAQTSFQATLILEKALKKKATAKIETPTQALEQREPCGWLVDEGQSTSVTLFPGGNLVHGLEIRVAGSSLYTLGKTYSSNDLLEMLGRRYVIKLLPPIYRSFEGGAR